MTSKFWQTGYRNGSASAVKEQEQEQEQEKMIEVFVECKDCGLSGVVWRLNLTKDEAENLYFQLREDLLY